MAEQFFSIKHNFPDLVRKLENLQRDLKNKVIVRALNETGKQGVSVAAREISKIYNVKVKDVRERLKIIKAFSGKLYMTIYVSGRRRSMNVMPFLKGRPNTKKPLNFKFKRAGGIKQIPGAFVLPGTRAVVQRTGVAGREQIKSLNVISVPQMFNSRRVNSVVMDEIMKRFQKNFTREFNSALRGFVK